MMPSFGLTVQMYQLSIFLTRSSLATALSFNSSNRDDFPRPTKATKKPIDSSVRNSLIYIGLTGVPSGLRPALGGEGRKENVQTESKTCRWVAEMAFCAVRKNPQEPAQTRGSRQKKANPEGLVFPLLVASRNMNAIAISSLKLRLEQRQLQQTNLFGTPQRPCEGL